MTDKIFTQGTIILTLFMHNFVTFFYKSQKNTWILEFTFLRKTIDECFSLWKAIIIWSVKNFIMSNESVLSTMIHFVKVLYGLVSRAISLTKPWICCINMHRKAMKRIWGILAWCREMIGWWKIIESVMLYSLGAVPEKVYRCLHVT